MALLLNLDGQKIYSYKTDKWFPMEQWSSATKQVNQCFLVSECVLSVGLLRTFKYI